MRSVRGSRPGALDRSPHATPSGGTACSSRRVVSLDLIELLGPPWQVPPIRPRLANGEKCGPGDNNQNPSNVPQLKEHLPIVLPHDQARLVALGHAIKNLLLAHKLVFAGHRENISMSKPSAIWPQVLSAARCLQSPCCQARRPTTSKSCGRVRRLGPPKSASIRRQRRACCGR